MIATTKVYSHGSNMDYGCKTIQKAYKNIIIRKIKEEQSLMIKGE
jgi:hypothetical protein